MYLYTHTVEPVSHTPPQTHTITYFFVLILIGVIIYKPIPNQYLIEKT